MPDRDLLDVIETKVSTATKARFDYAHDALGRRTNVSQTGEAFNRYSGGRLVRKWLYNDRSELTEEKAFFGTDPATVSTLVPGRQHNFSYDHLGNRVSAAVDNRAAAYTTNSLNQYTQRAVPGYVDATGLAPAAATVTVNGAAASRQGEYFWWQVSADNSASARHFGFPITSSLGGSVTRNVFLAQTPEPFAYDLDGNLLSDGRWDYTWDAENRLVAAQTRPALIGAVIPAAEARRVEFKYDHLGRRVQKTVRAGWNGTGYTTIESDLKFIYEGWSLLAEYNASGLSLVRLHTWGLDFSGTRGGAGGVGGLLQTAVYTGGNARYQPALDGGGAVYGQIDLATGLLDAAYEYAPYGEIIRSTGPRANALHFRYSTKYWDAELGLLHHDRRPYSPSLGRFLGRDPVAEQGGLNLYAYVLNDPVNDYDILGMDAAGKKKPAKEFRPGMMNATTITFNSGSSGSSGPSGGGAVRNADGTWTFTDRITNTSGQKSTNTYTDGPASSSAPASFYIGGGNSGKATAGGRGKGGVQFSIPGATEPPKNDPDPCAGLRSDLARVQAIERSATARIDEYTSSNRNPSGSAAFGYVGELVNDVADYGGLIQAGANIATIALPGAIDAGIDAFGYVSGGMMTTAGVIGLVGHPNINETEGMYHYTRGVATIAGTAVAQAGPFGRIAGAAFNLGSFHIQALTTIRENEIDIAMQNAAYASHRVDLQTRQRARDELTGIQKKMRENGCN